MRKIFEKLRDTNPGTALGVLVLVFIMHHARKPVYKMASYVDKISALI